MDIGDCIATHEGRSFIQNISSNSIKEKACFARLSSVLLLRALINKQNETNVAKLALRFMSNGLRKRNNAEMKIESASIRVTSACYTLKLVDRRERDVAKLIEPTESANTLGYNQTFSPFAYSSAIR